MAVFISAQAVGYEVQERRRVALPDERASLLRRHPNHVPHLFKLIGSIAGYAEEIRPVALYHLFAVAPYAIHRAERAASRDIVPRPGGADINLIFRRQSLAYEVTEVHRAQLPLGYFGPVRPDVSRIRAI